MVATHVLTNSFISPKELSDRAREVRERGGVVGRIVERRRTVSKNGC